MCLSSCEQDAETSKTVLPREQMIRNLMLRSSQDENFKRVLSELTTEHRLVNVLFYEIKLKSTLRLTSGHILGYADNESEQLVTIALAFEVVTHGGGQRFALRIIPVAHLNATQLQSYIIEVLTFINKCDGCVVSVVCDNFPLNQSVYNKFGGPDQVSIEGVSDNLFLVFDYVHVFKNLRNNWISEKLQTLTFRIVSIKYTACWKDIIKLYNEAK